MKVQRSSVAIVTIAVVASGLTFFACSNGPSSSETADAGSLGPVETGNDAASTPEPVVDSGTTPTPDPALDSGTTPTPGTSGNGTFVVYGDSRTNSGPHGQVLAAFAQKNPGLVLDTGDLWAGYGSATWTTILRQNPNLAALLDQNLYLVSRGNHETSSEFLAYVPTLVRGGKELYSFTWQGAFFVSLSMDPSTSAAKAYLAQELAKPEAQNAKWRFVYSHYPIYDSGDSHGVNGIAAVETLCDRYHVSMYFSGHEHIYERSYQMFGRSAVDRDDALTASRGTVYVVSGGGGAPLYTVSTPLASSRFHKTGAYHYTLVTMSPANLTVEAFDKTNTRFDSVQITP